MVTTTVKIFIDVFIGVWSLVLAWVWTAKFDKTNSGRNHELRRQCSPVSPASCSAIC